MKSLFSLAYWLPVAFYLSTGVIIGFGVLHGLASSELVSLMTPCRGIVMGRSRIIGPKAGRVHVYHRHCVCVSRS
jgi:hypothetical protein